MDFGVSVCGDDAIQHHVMMMERGREVSHYVHIAKTHKNPF